MTEQDAMQKWCPLARVIDQQESGNGIAITSYNRTVDGEPSEGALCIGRGCMAWWSSSDGSFGGCRAFGAGG